MAKWVKPGSIGKVAPGYDVRIVNNMGQEVPRGQQGNIGVRCKPEMPPGLFKGNFLFSLVSQVYSMQTDDFPFSLHLRFAKCLSFQCMNSMAESLMLK